MVEIIGNHPKINRKIVGLYSFDKAFVNHLGDLGIPIGVGIEIFGATGIGKSTLAYSLAGLISEKNLLLCDFEGFDVRWTSRLLDTIGFTGKVKVISDKKDEKQLDQTLDELGKDKSEYDVAILDSISAISPLSESDGNIGDANMGRRAFAMAQFTRKALHIYRFNKEKKTIIAINHWRAKLGGMGYEAPGGTIKNYLFTVQILLKRKEEFPDGSYILEGKVTKNRWGYSDRIFNVFIVAGIGLHRGLTAVQDCVMNDLATRKDGVIHIGENNYGRLSGLVKAAKQGDNDVFKPFIEVLERQDGIDSSKDSPDEFKASEGDEVSDSIAE